MKKTLCLLLALSTFVSFSSCGSSTGDTEDTEEIQTVLTYQDDESKGTIEKVIRDRVASKFDDHTTISSITINDDAGTPAEDDYIVILNLNWNQKNKADTAKQVIQMYSEDLAATVGNNASNVQEIAISWNVSYLNTTAKISYERKNNGMVIMDTVWGSGFDS